MTTPSILIVSILLMFTASSCDLFKKDKLGVEGKTHWTTTEIHDIESEFMSKKITFKKFGEIISEIDVNIKKDDAVQKQIYSEYIPLEDYLLRVLTSLETANDTIKDYDWRLSQVNIILSYTVSESNSGGINLSQGLIPLVIDQSKEKELTSFIQTEIHINPDSLVNYKGKFTGSNKDIPNLILKIKGLETYISKISGIIYKYKLGDLIASSDASEAAKIAARKIFALKASLSSEKKNLQQEATNMASNDSFARQLKDPIILTASALHNFQSAINDTVTTIKLICECRNKDNTGLKLTVLNTTLLNVSTEKVRSNQQEIFIVLKKTQKPKPAL